MALALAPVAPHAKTAIERTIAVRTGGRVEPRGSCQEYWIIGRHDLGTLMLCARLPKRRKPSKAKGALSRELSAMLVAASRPTPRDTFLDPFAGSGSLAAARLDLPVTRVWCSDLHLDRHNLEPRLITDKRARLLPEDALSLPSIGDASVDVIVTDPPWGEHDHLGQPYDRFARAVGSSFARVLHPSRGRYVLLVNRRNAGTMGAALAAAGLPAADQHDILVNGHPATVLIGRRTGNDQTSRTDASAARARQRRVMPRALRGRQMPRSSR